MSQYSLVKLGKPLRGKLKDVMSIVSPRTFARWVSGETKSVGKKAKTGRKRTEEQLRELIVTIARDLGAGYTRVMGELKKLGIKPPSRNTVKNILKAVGLDPGPQRGESTWDDFLQRHAVSLWQCDFFSRRVLTLGDDAPRLDVDEGQDERLGGKGRSTERWSARDT